MTAFVTSNQPDDLAVGSADRAVAQMANAFGIYLLSHVIAEAGVGIGSTATKVRTNTTCTFTVGGEFQTAVTSTDDVWTLSGTTVAKSSWQKYLLLWTTAGVASIQEGVQSTVSAAGVTWTNVSAVSPWDAFIQVVGTTKVIVGVLTVATSSAGTFIPGTTSLAAAQVTDTYVDGVDQSILPFVANPVATIFGSI